VPCFFVRNGFRTLSTLGSLISLILKFTLSLLLLRILIRIGRIRRLGNDRMPAIRGSTRNMRKSVGRIRKSARN